jgi:FkbM family methyltransferase
VQIGAFVGNSFNDPLFHFIRQIGSDPNFQIKIVLVEPVKKYFELLKKSYADVPGVLFENVAIAESSGMRDFYHLGVDPADYGFPDWLAQLGSLKAERIEAIWNKYEKNREYQEFCRAHQVVSRAECITLRELMEKHSIAEIDLLQIDAEGYDYEILKTIDFQSSRGPRFIRYERVLLFEQERECRAMLRSAGYQLRDCGQDTLAMRK